jgi:polysaccharide deacetylase 2 family uncharacterized protein YibQ
MPGPDVSAQPLEAEQAGGPGRTPLGLRALYWFWAVVLMALAGGAAALQVLGPPPGAASAAKSAADARLAAIPGAALPATHPDEAPGPTGATSAGQAGGTRQAGAPIAPPDPALLTFSPQYPDARLPRIAADGRKPMEVYAGGFELSDTRPRIALLLAGLGQSDVYSDDAARLLPAGVTFALSPYANQPDRLIREIRARGHEFLVSVPMEPQGYPVNDAGPQSLLSGATPTQNMQRLDWALGRFTGYVGATSALDGLRGERFTAASMQFNPVLDTLAARGLLYVDATPANARTAPLDSGHAPTRSVDIVIDEPAVRVEIERKLAALEQIARDRGSAIGLAGLPRPVTIDRIATWANTLAAHGIALAPVSVVVLRSPTTAAAGSQSLNAPSAGAALSAAHTARER